MKHRKKTVPSLNVRANFSASISDVPFISLADTEWLRGKISRATGETMDVQFRFPTVQTIFAREGLTALARTAEKRGSDGAAAAHARLRVRFPLSLISIANSFIRAYDFLGRYLLPLNSVTYGVRQPD